MYNGSNSRALYVNDLIWPYIGRKKNFDGYYYY